MQAFAPGLRFSIIQPPVDPAMTQSSLNAPKPAVQLQHGRPQLGLRGAELREQSQVIHLRSKCLSMEGDELGVEASIRSSRCELVDQELETRQSVLGSAECTSPAHHRSQNVQQYHASKVIVQPTLADPKARIFVFETDEPDSEEQAEDQYMQGQVQAIQEEEEEQEQYRPREYSHTSKIEHAILHRSDWLPSKARRNSSSSEQQQQQQEQSEFHYQEIHRSKQNKNLQNQLKLPGQSKSRQKLEYDLKISQKMKYNFLSRPLATSFEIQAVVEIEEGLLPFNKKYILRQKSDRAVLMSAKKQFMSMTSRFILSASESDHSRRSRNFIGILESNFVGTTWNLVIPAISAYLNQDKLCEKFLQIGRIEYDTSILGSKSLRTMAVILPKPTRDPKASNQKQEHQSQQIKLKSATPKLTKGKYSMDFKGNAKMASSKNFILEWGEAQSLILGKISESQYNMTIRNPLSLVQAFAIGLSSLDGKLMVN